jgi:predicted nucleotidyltransferase
MTPLDSHASPTARLGHPTMFFHPLDSVLSSSVRVRVLRALIGLTRPVSGREAARLAGTSLPMTQRTLAEFVELGVLLLEETPAQHLYRINRDNLLVREGLVPLFEAEERRSRAIFEELRRVLTESPEAKDATVETAIVFGSAARGDDAPGSDFDLLVVTRDPAGAERVHDLLSARAPGLRTRFGLTLSPVVLDREVVRREAGDGAGLIQDVLRDGRRICGRTLEEIVHG